ncbi:hypothetical protein, partial [Klebsiella pneumoniae]|uniref:hypothetical protein n=1 Tax=Klebsiella pneumoniae TaxID=573 RepID=UPI00272FB6F7
TCSASDEVVFFFDLPFAICAPPALAMETGVTLQSVISRMAVSLLRNAQMGRQPHFEPTNG